MFGKKKSLNLKSSYLRYFKEKSHEIWNVNFKHGFFIALSRKKKKKKQDLLMVWSRDKSVLRP